MSNVMNFSYGNAQVRGLVVEGEPWFVLKDVCGVLDISNYRDVAARLDSDERGSVWVDTLGGMQEMVAVNESGLYTVILRSDKPEAKPFRKWVTHEVLPQIRKTGGYGRPEITADQYGVRRVVLDDELYVRLDDLYDEDVLDRTRRAYQGETLALADKRIAKQAEQDAHEIEKTHPCRYEDLEAELARRGADIEWVLHQMSARLNPAWYAKAGKEEFFTDEFRGIALRAVERVYEG